MSGMVVGALEGTRVAANDEIAPGFFRLAFPRAFDFIPGQSIALTTDRAIPPRFYSVASGRDEPMAEVLYDLVPYGLLTPRLSRLMPGDPLFVSPPLGSFRDEEGPAFWIAAGTGIALPPLRRQPHGRGRQGHPHWQGGAVRECDR